MYVLIGTLYKFKPNPILVMIYCTSTGTYLYAASMSDSNIVAHSKSAICLYTVYGTMKYYYTITF